MTLHRRFLSMDVLCLGVEIPFIEDQVHLLLLQIGLGDLAGFLMMI
jgi:hypothetical protein